MAGRTEYFSASLAEYRRRLLEWYERNARDLPWRLERTVYGTWISEIMLQQTQVQTVIPFWERFLGKFPEVRSLAAATESEVLALWSGLGYYRRARQLHAAAQIIVSDLDGRLPTDHRGWSQLPGIGPYTAGAIASQALSARVPAVDANARRVLLRWLQSDPEPDPALGPHGLEALAAELVPEQDPGRWNQAVMELGALICKPTRPDCGACPMRGLCRADSEGITDLVPAPAKRPSGLEVSTVQLALLRNDEIYLVPGGSPHLKWRSTARVVRNDFSGLHGGLWGLPMGPWVVRQETRSVGPLKDQLDPAIERLRISFPTDHLQWLGELGHFKHAITRYRLTVRVVGVAISNRLETELTSGVSGLLEGEEVTTAGEWSRLVDVSRPLSALGRKGLQIIRDGNC